ncbi:mitochondrial 54S ribosomal protein YmL41 [Elasticomyces elasticus]|nr:mitochondrial 54S ribosomal protein YmL41 [Elasticomyces elasticus]
MALVTKAPFRVGQKEIHLPNFTLTLLRMANQPPTSATFLVPLSLNKLDLRDYLYHAYNLRVLSVRSYIIQSKVAPTRPKSQARNWNRPQAQKRMTVEMERPFVWPDTPADLEPWNHETREKTRAAQEKYQKTAGRDADTRPDAGERKSLREQAKELLEGKERWTPVVGGSGGGRRR